MGVPDGSCAVDEYHDVVTGLCLQCAVVCRNVKKPDSLCLYYCSDFYNRLSTTTVGSLPNHSGLILTPLLLGSVTAGVFLAVFCMLISVLIWLRRRRMPPSPSNDENYYVKYRRRDGHQRRFRHQNSVQETGKQESEKSILYVSPCSSLPPSSESSLTAKTVYDTTRSRLTMIAAVTKRGIDERTNHVTTDAVVSSRAAESFGSLDETLPKLAHDSVQSFSKNLSNSQYSDETAGIVLRPPNENKIRPP